MDNQTLITNGSTAFADLEAALIALRDKFAIVKAAVNAGIGPIAGPYLGARVLHMLSEGEQSANESFLSVLDAHRELSTFLKNNGVILQPDGGGVRPELEKE